MKSNIALLILVLTFVAGCRRGDAPLPPPPPAETTPTATPAGADPTATPTTPTTPAAPGAPGAPATSIAGDPIADLPDYPGATRIGYSVAPKTGFSKAVEAKFFTNEPYEKVKAFYEKAIADGGWRIIKTDAKVGEIEWELVKGTSLAEIEVDQERTGGVEVKLERKDR